MVSFDKRALGSRALLLFHSSVPGERATMDTAACQPFRSEFASSA